MKVEPRIFWIQANHVAGSLRLYRIHQVPDQWTVVGLSARHDDLFQV